MPAVSTAQQHAFQAAKAGANFPLARKLRASMSSEKLDEFASGSEAGKPEHVRSSTSTAAHSLRHLKKRIKDHGGR